MKWNLRWAAARRDIWRPSQLLVAFEEVGFTPSLSKVAALWGQKPVTVRLEDLDMICAALHCEVADLLEAETMSGVDETRSENRQAAAGNASAARPSPRTSRTRPSAPPN